MFCIIITHVKGVSVIPIYLARKSMHRVYFGLALSFLWLVLGCTAAVSQDAKQPLRVGIIETDQQGITGTTSGFQIALATEIADHLGTEVEVVTFDSFDALVEAQANGKTDIIAATELLLRLKTTNIFSQPVSKETVRLTVAKDRTPAIRPDVLENLRIGYVLPVSSQEEQSLLDTNIPVAVGSPSDALIALLSGDVDAVLLPVSVAFRTAQRARLDDRIIFHPMPIKQFDRFVALHESRSDLMPDIEQAIAAIKENGRLSALRHDYFLDVQAPPTGSLTVGVNHFPPYQIVKDDGTFAGFGVEVLQDLADITGIDLSFVAVTPEEWVAGPGPGKVDMLATAGISASRLARMDFTLPVQEAPFSIFALASDAKGIAGLDDLAGRRVGIQEDNLAYRLVSNRDDFDLVFAEDADDLVDTLLDGRADAILYPTRNVLDTLALRSLEDEIVEVKPPFFVSLRAPALRFGLGEMRERLNAAIPQYLISDDYRALANTFFEAPVFWTVSRVRLAGGLILLAASSVVVATLWNQWRVRAKALDIRQAQAAEVAAIRDELEVVFNAATSGIVALDQSGTIVRINNRARHMLGGVSDQLPFAWPSHIGFLESSALAPMEQSADPIRRALSGHSLNGETHLLRRTQQGEQQRYVRLESTHLTNEEHGIAIVLVIDDVSNEERNRQVVERKSRLDALGQLTGGIAHDFNNVLASMIYAVSLAKNAKDAEKRNKYLDIANSSVERGKELTARLLAFAKRQPGLAASKSVETILTDFEQLIRPMLEEAVEISFETSPSDIQVFCDQTQLETALMNLVLNSRDAILRSGKGNRIDVKARAVLSTNDDLDERQLKGKAADRGKVPSGSSFRFVEMSVSDNGPGMDSETLARSTDPFFTTKDTNSGTGLGLSMVYGFVRQSDGDMQIYSEVDLGTNVQLILPRGTAVGSREPLVLEDVPVQGDGQTILVVEDEPELLVIMCSVLEELGYHVLQATSGHHALRLVEANAHFDLLLTDVVMPGGLGGFELATKIREIVPTVPVIYTSGYTGFTTLEMGEIQAPLLQKPSPTAELAAALDKALQAES